MGQMMGKVIVVDVRLKTGKQGRIKLEQHQDENKVLEDVQSTVGLGQGQGQGQVGVGLIPGWIDTSTCCPNPS